MVSRLLALIKFLYADGRDLWAKDIERILCNICQEQVVSEDQSVLSTVVEDQSVLSPRLPENVVKLLRKAEYALKTNHEKLVVAREIRVLLEQLEPVVVDHKTFVCTCDCSTKCPLGKSGMAGRCTVTELLANGCMIKGK